MPRVKIQALVTIWDKDGKVVARGKSKPRNLILDNFGLFLAALIAAPGTGAFSVTLKNDAGASKAFYIRSGTASGELSFYTKGLGPGTRLRVGSGTTAPARTDYTITTAFTTSPESGLFDTGTGSYAAGAVTFSGSITAGGSGTVNEVGFYGRWLSETDDVLHNVMLFHDLVSPGVSFSVGQIIGVSYSVTL